MAAFDKPFTSTTSQGSAQPSRCSQADTLNSNNAVTCMLNAADDKIQRLLTAWQQNRTEVYAKRMSITHLDVLGDCTAKDRKKYIAIDARGSGHFLVDKTTEQVYSIKGYGVPNLKKPRGTVEFLTQFIVGCTAKNVDYTTTYWYALHPTA